MSAAVMIVMSLLPGIPMLPFLLLGGGAGALAYLDRQAQHGRGRDAADARPRPRPRPAPAEEPISAALKIDDLKIELGYAPAAAGQLAGRQRPAHRADQGAAPLARGRDGLRHAGGAHPRQCPARRQHLRDPDQGGRGRHRRGLARTVHGHGPDRRRRCSCRACTRSSRPSACRPPGSTPALKEEAAIKGYTVVDAATVLATHLTEILKANMAELLSYAEVQKLLKELPKEQSELVKDIVPTPDHHHRHPARAADAARRADFDPRPRHHPGGHRRRPELHPQPAALAEHVRARLARQICAQHSAPAGYLPLISLSPQWEQAFAEVHHRPGRRPAARHGAVAAAANSSRLVRDRFEEAARQGEAPVLVTSPGAAPLRALDRRALPLADDRAVAVRNPPAGAAEDGGEHLSG